MTKENKLIQEIQAIMEKAHRSLKDAKILLAEGGYGSASSRAYYAVFHLLQACLLTKGLTYSKHSGVISGFSQHFLKTKIFPKEFAKDIDRLREDREIGDYDYHTTITKEKATQDVEIAENIGGALKKYLADFTASA